MKNAAAIKTNMTQLADGTYIINGIEYKGKHLPKPGMSVCRYVGTDRYAYKIESVAPDYSYFKLVNGGVAVLVTRKNSRRYGTYVQGFINAKGKAKPGDTPYITCMTYNTYYVVDYEATDYRDPHL
jgi:hypothetical protein